MSKIDYLGNTRNEKAYKKFILASLTEKRLSPLKAIRLGCLECNGFQEVEVKDCQSIDCVFHKFRMGRNTTGQDRNCSCARPDES